MDRDKIYALLRPFVIFGLVPLMTFARAPKVYSRLSMILSLTTLAGVLFLIIYLGLAVVQRRNPSFFQYTLPATGYDKITWTPETFPIEISTEVGNLKLVDDYMWTASAFTNVPGDPMQFWPFATADCVDPQIPGSLCFPKAPIPNIGEAFITNQGPDGFVAELVTCIQGIPGASPSCSAPNVINGELTRGGFTV